jgi:hypothetical protein
VGKHFTYPFHSILTLSLVFLHTYLFLSMFLYLYQYSFYTFFLFILHSTFLPTVYFLTVGSTIFLQFTIRLSLQFAPIRFSIHTVYSLRLSVYDLLYSLLSYGLLYGFLFYIIYLLFIFYQSSLIF